MILTNYPAKVLNLSSHLEMFLMVVGVLEKYLISFNVDLEASLKVINFACELACNIINKNTYFLLTNIHGTKYLEVRQKDN